MMYTIATLSPYQVYQVHKPMPMDKGALAHCREQNYAESGLRT